MVVPLPEPPRGVEPVRKTGDCLRESGDRQLSSGRAGAVVGEGPAIGVAGAVDDD